VSIRTAAAMDTVRWSLKFLLCCLLVIIGLLVAFILFPPAGLAPQISGTQLGLTYAVMFVSIIAVVRLAKSQRPGRHCWIAVHSGVAAICLVSMALPPQWSGLITISAVVLFVLTPNVLNDLASRGFAAGHLRAAASYARLLCFFHPSKEFRFQSSFLSAQALGSIERKVGACRALASHATPEELAVLNCSIFVAQDDWLGVLTQVRSMGDAKPMAWLEVRALGELGRVEEMAMTHAIAVAESVLKPSDVLSCRLFVLAFTGRVEGVRSLLSRQLRSLRSERKAYWTFIACQAAGAHDEEARRRLQAAADATDDETFRRAARRHLDASLVAEAVRKD
jgi:hypothetical protein